MSEWTEPRDEFAEQTLAGCFLREAAVAEPVLALVSGVDWWEPNTRAVVEACIDLTGQAKPCDPVSVRVELLRRGQRGRPTDAAWLLDLLGAACTPEQATYHARHLRDLAVRRDVMRAAQRALQAAADPEADPYDVAASTSITAAGLAERNDPAAPSTARDSGEFCEGTLDYDWMIPGLLEKGDRLLITGGEGGGKSVLVRQLAVSIAAGVHPFDGTRFDPRRVLLVDLENGERTLRRHLIGLRAHAATIGRAIPHSGLMIESRPSGIDLTKAADEAWLNRICEDVQPDLLVIGPLYRMHATDMNKEEPARHLTRVIDTIRARHSCCVVMETHSPHANGMTGKRSLRPVGSSLYMRWPEFGYGLLPGKPDEPVTLQAWRGPRDERSWPEKLRRGLPGSEWPWVQSNGFEHLRNYYDPQDGAA